MTDRNYYQLVELHDKYAERGLRILAFPCNQFGSQEPGSNAEIRDYVISRYGPKFDIFAKIEVNGANANPLYKYLQNKKQGTLINRIKWNFSKIIIVLGAGYFGSSAYNLCVDCTSFDTQRRLLGTLDIQVKLQFLINKEGIPVKRYGPTTDPMSIAQDIEKEL